MEPNEAGSEETEYLALTLMTQTTRRSLLREMEVLALLVVMTLNQPTTLTRSLMILQEVVTSLLIPSKQTLLHLLTLIQALTSRPAVVVINQPTTLLINLMTPIRNLMTHQVAEVVISQQEATRLTQSHQIPKRLTLILQLVEAALTQPMTLTRNPMIQLAAVVTSQQEAIQLTQRLTQKLILLPILRQTLRRQIQILLLVVAAQTHPVVMIRNLLTLPVKLMIQLAKQRMKRQLVVMRMRRQLEVMKMKRQLEMTKKKRKQATHTIHSLNSTTRISQLAITTNSLDTITLSRHLTLRIT